MLRKMDKLLLAVLLVLALVVGLAWLHSSTVGYERTWSDPADQTCGRLATAHGRFVFQWCDLKSRRQADDPALKWKRRPPAEFFVGTNPAGERTVVSCGEYAIPFTFPSPGMFFGLSTKLDDTADPVTTTRWSNEWREYTVSYWFALILILIAPVGQCIRWLLHGRKPEKAAPREGTGAIERGAAPDGSGR
jgi:hypothetical protein